VFCIVLPRPCSACIPRPCLRPCKNAQVKSRGYFPHPTQIVCWSRIPNAVAVKTEPCMRSLAITSQASVSTGNSITLEDMYAVVKPAKNCFEFFPFNLQLPGKRNCFKSCSCNNCLVHWHMLGKPIFHRSTHLYTVLRQRRPYQQHVLEYTSHGMCDRHMALCQRRRRSLSRGPPNIQVLSYPPVRNLGQTHSPRMKSTTDRP
jgi:hypothetical protein